MSSSTKSLSNGPCFSTWILCIYDLKFRIIKIKLHLRKIILNKVESTSKSRRFHRTYPEELSILVRTLIFISKTHDDFEGVRPKTKYVGTGIRGDRYHDLNFCRIDRISFLTVLLDLEIPFPRIYAETWTGNSWSL